MITNLVCPGCVPFKTDELSENINTIKPVFKGSVTKERRHIVPLPPHHPNVMYVNFDVVEMVEIDVFFTEYRY